MSEQGCMSEQVKPKLILTKRETSEIVHAIFYAEHSAHGTNGHNQLMLIATLAKYIGFTVQGYATLELPDDIPISVVESSR